MRFHGGCSDARGEGESFPRATRPSGESSHVRWFPE